MIKYVPNSKENIESMLKEINVKSIDELFSDIPEGIKIKDGMGIGQGMSEYEAYKKIKAMADKNKADYTSYLGAGSYDHIIPSAVSSILSRSEFYTAYTPYQAEISQGLLQTIYEFQSMVCEITGMDATNASLYDGFTAAVESGVIALNTIKKSDTILYSRTIHPYMKEVLKTNFSDLDVKLVEIDEENGTTSLTDLKNKLSDKTACVILQNPNFYGIIEDYTGFSEMIHETKTMMVLSSNPVALSYLKNQREWGADIAIGDFQPFGLHSYFGGPSVGYIAVTMDHLRKLPGRIVGQTVDQEGKRGFVLTLQAREQHIKRERATSNICSNQALAAVANTVYMTLIGKKGYRELGKQCFSRAHFMVQELEKIKGVSLAFPGKFFHEFLIKLPVKAGDVIEKMMGYRIFAGIDAHQLDSRINENLLLVAVTEKRTKEEILSYVSALRNILK